MNDRFFHEEGKKIVAAMMKKEMAKKYNNNSTTESRLIKEQFDYCSLDCIWTHPLSGAQVYVGDLNAAQGLWCLLPKKIFHIVNC